MADNLTVRSGGADAAAPLETPKDKALDDGRAELEALRAKAKSRHGKSLNDKTLKGIIQRRKAKLKHQAKLSDTKEAFKAQQGKEGVGDKAQDIKARAQKTTGAAETKGQDGLTGEDRKSIRSSPKAGPKLPPTLAKAATPEEATSILSRIFGTVLIDGEEMDLEAYAKTLKQRPPTKLTDKNKTQAQQRGKGQATTRGGTSQRAPGTPLQKGSAGLQSSNQGSTGQQSGTTLGQTGRPPMQTGTRQPGGQAPPQQQGGRGGPGTRSTAAGQSAPAGQSGGPGTTAGRGGGPGPMGGQPSGAGSTQGQAGAQGPQGDGPSSGISGSGTPPGTPGGPGARPGMPGPGAMPGGMPNAGGPGVGAPMADLSFRVGSSDTRLSETSVSSDGLFNAGGGLETGSSFDGMSFNWDAFFTLFAIRSQRDMHEWRKLMKELRRLEGELAVQGYQTQIALTKMRQFFERKKVFSQVADAVGRASRDYRRGKVNLITGHNPGAVDGLNNERRDWFKNTTGPDGRPLSEAYPGGFMTARKRAELQAANREIVAQYDDMMGRLLNSGGRVAVLGVMMDARAEQVVQDAEQFRSLLTGPLAKHLRDKRVDNNKWHSVHLSDEELQTLEAASPEAAEVAKSYRQLNQARSARQSELYSEISTARSQLRVEVLRMMRDPETAAVLNSKRHDLNETALRYRKAAETAHGPKPENKSQNPAEEARLHALEASTLRQLVTLDIAMARGETPTPEQRAEYQSTQYDAEANVQSVNARLQFLDSEALNPSRRREQAHNRTNSAIEFVNSEIKRRDIATEPRSDRRERLVELREQKEHEYSAVQGQLESATETRDQNHQLRRSGALRRVINAIDKEISLVDLEHSSDRVDGLKTRKAELSEEASQRRQQWQNARGNNRPEARDRRSARLTSMLQERVARLKTLEAELATADAQLNDAKNPAERAVALQNRLGVARRKGYIEGEIEAIKNELGNLGETRAERATRIAEARPNLVRSANQAREHADHLDYLINGDPYENGPLVGPPNPHRIAPEDAYVRNDSPSDLGHLRRLVSAGNRVKNVRSEYVLDLDTEKMIERGKSFIDDLGNRIDNSPFITAVDNAIQGAIGMAKRHRKEVDSELRSTVNKAQGMINQLIQLLGVSRSR